MKQETFDKVAKALLQQKAFSVYEGRCRYRAEELKCAAGHLIPDEKYEKRFDASKSCLAHEGEIRIILMSEGHDPDFVRELQIIHDTSTDDSYDWLLKMKQCAIEHKLNYKILKPFLIDHIAPW